MSHPDDRRYTDSHEWIQDAGDGTFLVGISDHAQAELGDLVFVEQPAVEDTFTSGEVVCVVESTKTAADVYCPCDCQVVAVNEALADAPELVNQDPHERGWLYRFRPTGAFSLAACKSAAAYEAAL